MGIEEHDGSVTKSGTNAELQTVLLEGTWNKTPTSDAAGTTSTASRTDAPSDSPTTTTDSTAPTSDSTAPTFVNSDGSPISDRDLSSVASSDTKHAGAPVELAAMTIGGLSLPNDFVRVSDSPRAARNSPIARLQNAAHDSVGSADYGNKVPNNAREFPGTSIEINHQCASTSSDWLMRAGIMNGKDYKITVDGLSTYLPKHGFSKVDLKGDFDPSKFPDGPIGFIAGKGNVEDGTNHIAFVEKRNGEVRIIHNNFRTGRVIDQNINEKFYNPDGTPAYDNLSLFVFKRR